MNTKINSYKNIFVLPVIGFYFLFIYKFGTNVPFWDEWELIFLFEKFYYGQINWLNIVFHKHNEHIIGFSFIFMVIEYLFTDVNIKFLQYFNGLLQIIAFLLAINFMEDGIKKYYKYYWIVLIGFCFFSLSQYQNMLWGFQTAWFLISILLILVIRILFDIENKKPVIFFIAILLSIFATLTSGQGLLIWPVGFFVLLANSNYNLKLSLKSNYAKYWILCSIGGIMAYYLGSPDSYRGILKISGIPIQQSLIIFIGLFGSIFGFSSIKITFSLGIVILVCMFYVIYKIYLSENRKIYIIPLSLILYGFLFNILISLSRSQYGLGVMVDSHYSAYNLLVLSGIVTALFIDKSVDRNHDTKEYKSASILLISVVTILFYVSSTMNGVLNGARWRDSQLLSLNVLSNDQLMKNDFLVKRLLFGDADYVRKRAFFLKVNAMSIFSDHLDDEDLRYKNSFTPPTSFKKIYEENPIYKDALYQAWYVYTVDRNLKGAFQPDSPEFAPQYIAWCINAASEGGHYLSEYLSPYISDYQKIISIIKVTKPAK